MADLERQLKQLAAQASVLSEAQGAQYDPQTSHAHAESQAPPALHGEPLLDEIKRRSATLNGPTSYRRLIQWVELELKARRHTPPQRVRTPRQIVLEEFQGDECSVVAKVLGIHRTTVWRWRIAAGCNGSNGLPLEGL